MRAGRRIAVAAVLGIVAALAPPFYAAAAASTLYVGGAGCSDSGPGTQAQPYCTISKAAAVATFGQTVLVSSGTYTEDVTPANSGTAGNPITFQAAPGATATITGAADAFTISGRSWITISGFTITGTTSSGIYLSNASNITVSGNTVTASGQRVQGANAVGIYVGGTSNSTISGNTVDNNSATGIYLTQGSTGVTVAGNEASFNAYGWERNANGIDVMAPGNTIIKNVVHDNEDSGIQFYPGGNNNVAADNVSYDNMGITSVQLVNCDHPTTGNTSDCFTGDHGIDDLDVTGNQITGNTVYANKTAGINVEGIPAGTPSGFVIKNNVSVDNAINCPDGAGGTTTCPATKGNIRVDSTSRHRHGPRPRRDVAGRSRLHGDLGQHVLQDPVGVPGGLRPGTEREAGQSGVREPVQRQLPTHRGLTRHRHGGLGRGRGAVHRHHGELAGGRPVHAEHRCGTAQLRRRRGV